MKPIAVFYHVRLMGGEPCIDFDHASQIVASQTNALANSGLIASASHIECGLNGEGIEVLGHLFPGPIIHHPAGMGELPTINRVREFAHSHPGWYLFYHHTKGAIHKGDAMYASWRNCMEQNLVWRWRQCVEAMEQGVESVGCHWMTPEQYGHLVKSPFWGGNFWWATTDFIRTLPPIMANGTQRSDFYEAEAWIGRGPRRPRVIDHHNAFPGHLCQVTGY